MANVTYYAWSNIHYGSDVAENGDRTKKVVKIGEQVDAAKLGISEKKFQGLIDCGAVRTKKYPKELIGSSTGISPRQFEARKARAILEGVQDQLNNDPVPEPKSVLEAGTGPSPQAVK